MNPTKKCDICAHQSAYVLRTIVSCGHDRKDRQYLVCEKCYCELQYDLSSALSDDLTKHFGREAGKREYFNSQLSSTENTE